MTNARYDSFGRLENSFVLLQEEARDSGSSVLRGAVSGIVPGAVIGYTSTALTAAALMFKAMTGVVENPDVPLYIISGMNSVIMGSGAGIIGMAAGSAVGAAVGAVKGIFD